MTLKLRLADSQKEVKKLKQEKLESEKELKQLQTKLSLFEFEVKQVISDETDIGCSRRCSIKKRLEKALSKHKPAPPPL